MSQHTIFDGSRRIGARAALVFACGLLAGCARGTERAPASPLATSSSPNRPATFEHRGKPYCFAGANNYYLAYMPRPMVDDVFASAKAMGLGVMRMWGFIDIGSRDGSVDSVDPNLDPDGTKNGAYFQYWDSKLGRPAYNDGKTGLERLDYALARAAERELKVILVLTNNWRDFGGMDQYLRWFGRSKHHEFYTAPEVRQAYKNWVAHLVHRTNSVNGRLYRDDPTIFSFELGNEPRCKGSGPRSTGWTNETIVKWVEEMTTFVHSIAPNHMVSVGDEGFLDWGGEHWAYEAQDGVDHEAITALPGVDFGTFHLYPEHWGETLEWGKRWVADHVAVARRLGKPTILEEYGVKVERNARGVIVDGLHERLGAYRSWNDALLEHGGNASLVWLLSGRDTFRGGLYPDYDEYTTYRGDETARLLSAYANEFANAPACRAHDGTPSSSPTEFVRVRKQRERVALVSSGWAFSDG